MESPVLHLTDPDYKLDGFTLRNSFLGRGRQLSIHINRGDHTEMIVFWTEGQETKTQTTCTDSSHDCGCP